MSSTLLAPYGYTASTCGYCSPSGSRSAEASSLKYGMEAPRMTCPFYQDLVDRGWRRSGDYIYHPDMGRTCCPQYTIRLSALEFKPNKKQRQVMNRWNRFLSIGRRPGDEVKGDEEPNKGKGKAKAGNEDFADDLRAFEHGYGVQGVHDFQTELVPAKVTDETYRLYKRYQVAVHKDRPEKITKKGFDHFLCANPLIRSKILYAPSGAHTARPVSHYGAYHLLYRVDGELIGISVIDILPSCVSSVYFIWDPDWAWASLGKLSAMREVALVRDMHKAGAHSMQYLYMGYWIANCTKMRYKGEYSPSSLLDPGTNTFHPLSSSLDGFLQAHPSGYHPFAEINDDVRPLPANGVNHDDEGGEDFEMEEVESLGDFPSPPPVSFANPKSFLGEEVDNLIITLSLDRAGKRMERTLRLGDVPFIAPDEVKAVVQELAAAVGIDRFAKAGAISGDQETASICFG